MWDCIVDTWVVEAVREGRAMWRWAWYHPNSPVPPDLVIVPETGERFSWSSGWCGRGLHTP